MKPLVQWLIYLIENAMKALKSARAKQVLSQLDAAETLRYVLGSPAGGPVTRPSFKFRDSNGVVREFQARIVPKAV